jgi:hypothetical protein
VISTLSIATGVAGNMIEACVNEKVATTCTLGKYAGLHIEFLLLAKRNTIMDR